MAGFRLEVPEHPLLAQFFFRVHDYNLQKLMSFLKNISSVLPPLSAKTGLQKFSEFCKDATNNLTDYKTFGGFVRITKTKRWFTTVM